MATQTQIQWCHTTVNPIMGCGGCELFPKPDIIMLEIDRQLILTGIAEWERGSARKLFREQLKESWNKLSTTIKKPGPGQGNRVSISPYCKTSCLR